MVCLLRCRGICQGHKIKEKSLFLLIKNLNIFKISNCVWFYKMFIINRIIKHCICVVSLCEQSYEEELPLLPQTDKTELFKMTLPWGITRGGCHFFQLHANQSIKWCLCLVLEYDMSISMEFEIFKLKIRAQPKTCLLMNFLYNTIYTWCTKEKNVLRFANIFPGCKWLS